LVRSEDVKEEEEVCSWVNSKLANPTLASGIAQLLMAFNLSSSTSTEAKSIKEGSSIETSWQ